MPIWSARPAGKGTNPRTPWPRYGGVIYDPGGSQVQDSSGAVLSGVPGHEDRLR
jgi:hypothetical protein